ncbi:relaxase/mobilization nuclease domain-containing protein [Magnetovibrio blakemorei]|nr:hypothetical protein [Magnetovibrio blakemorei]
MIKDDLEDWDWVKMGRFSDADERIVQGIMGKRFRLAHPPSTVSHPKGKVRRKGAHAKRDASLSGRAFVIEKGYRYARGKEAVIRARSRPKSDHGVMTLLRYVARTRREDEKNGQYGAVSLWDGFGAPLSVEDIHAVRKRWELLPDQDNLSRTALKHLKKSDLSALHAMGGRERLRHVQAWHFVFSIAEDGAEEGGERKLRNAMRVTVDGAFTAKGHKTVWGIHQDHTDHIHAHVVVRALSDFGGRLHSDIHGDYLHALRLRFAENLKLSGLDYNASWRVDRRYERERIMAGLEPLHDDPSPWRQGKAWRDPYANLNTWPYYFGDRAVQNMERIEDAKAIIRQLAEDAERHEWTTIAAQALRQLLDEPLIQTSWLKRAYHFVSRSAENDDVPDEYRELFEYLKTMYYDPADALASWQHMALDGAYRDQQGKVQYPHRGLANWTLRHRPEYLGCVKANAYVMGGDKELKKILRTAWLPKSHQVPEPPEYVDVFAKYREIRRVQKDRAKVIAELKRLFHRYQADWPGTWLPEVTDQAIGQAMLIEIGHKLPKVMGAGPIKAASKWKPGAGGQSGASDPVGDYGAPVLHAENENATDQKQERSQKPKSRSRRNASRGRG